MRKSIHIILFYAIFIFLAGCHHTSKKRTTRKVPFSWQQCIKKECVEPTAITIFIHGTNLPDFFLQFPFIYNLGYAPKGLSLAYDLHEKYRLKNIQILAVEDPEQFPLESLYIFGWDGSLSFKKRHKEAEKLYHELCAIRKCWPNIPITLIGHSHGGNIALNLARVAQERRDDQLTIDRLVLLACPVQKATAHHIHAPCFKRIYALYSPIDCVQVLDPQGLYAESKTDSKSDCPLFSQRQFPHNEKLMQCRLRFNGHGMAHIDFILRPFLRKLPGILKDLENPEKCPHLKKVRRKNEYILRLKG